MNDRALRGYGAHEALDARAAVSLKRARPLVRKSRWQCVLPTSPGEVTLCRILGVVIFLELAFLGWCIWSR